MTEAAINAATEDKINSMLQFNSPQKQYKQMSLEKAGTWNWKVSVKYTFTQHYRATRDYQLMWI